MGLFSSKKILIVETSVSKVIETTPNDFVGDAIVSAILASGDIPEYIKYAYANNYSTMVDSMLRYAKSGGYIYGLPEGSAGTLFTADHGTVRDIIQTEIPTATSIGSIQVKNYDPYVDAMVYLQNNYNWNLTSNIVSHPYLGPMKVVDVQSNEIPSNILNNYYFYNYFNTITIFLIEPSLFIGFGNEDNIRQATALTIPKSTTDPLNSIYYYASYVDSGKTYYWQYNTATGIYPELSELDQDSYYSQYLPIVPLRVNRTNVTNNKSSSWYLTTKKLLKKIQIDVDDVIKGLNNNPSIADVDDAFMLYGVSIYSNVEASIKYLFNYFKGLANTSVSKEVFDLLMTNIISILDPIPEDEGGVAWGVQYETTINVDPPTNTVVINESDHQVTLTYNYASFNIYTGVIGTRGTYTKDIIDQDTIRYNIILPYSWEENNSTVTVTVPLSYMRIRHQVTETQYEEVIVSGLIHRVTVPGTGRVIENTLSSSSTTPLKFYLPLSYIALHELNAKDAVDVLYDSLIITVTAIKEEKIKWYQSGFLGFLFKIVLAIAIAWVAPQLAAYIGIPNVTILTFSEAIVVGITGFVISEIAGKIFTGTIGMLIKAALAYYQMGGFQGLTGSIKDLPWAELILKATSGVFEYLQNGIKSDLAELMKESSDFAEMISKQQDEIERINEELGLNTFYDRIYLDSVVNLFDPNESPSQYYARTIHLGNPGILGLDAVHTYCSNALSLPKPNLTDNVLIV